jgi:hypothetical protein
MDSRFSIDRRGILTGFAVLNVAVLTGVEAIGAQVSTPDKAMRLLARLQGDLSGKPVYGYQKGSVFGLRTNQGLALADYGLRLYDYEGAGVSRTRVLENGDIETQSRSFLFYTDPETGAYLKEWKNPVTGEIIPVPPFRGGISGSTLTPNGPKVRANFSMESTVFNTPTKLEVVTMGPTSWVKRAAFTRWTPSGSTKARTEFTQDTWMLPTDLLLDEKASFLPATSAWTSVTEWQTWLKMPADFLGDQLWRADGMKTQKLSDLPPAFVAHSNKEFPGIFTDPIEFPS